MTHSSSSRNRSEVERSAAEAQQIALVPLGTPEVERYRCPPADTPYPLEYAFHLLGDVQGKTVLDLGCGAGENLVVLAERGARVTGIDISPDLVSIAEKRVRNAGLEASLFVGDACQTGLAEESFDVIFAVALVHHLEIEAVRGEMWRLLRRGGFIVLKEPTRFSTFYDRMRRLLPAHEMASEYEHPLTREELATVMAPFKATGTRYFRLPIVPVITRVVPSKEDTAWRASDWILRNFSVAQHYATGVVTKLQKA